MKMETNKKLKWSVPALVDLNQDEADGTQFECCVPGSSATKCNSGSLADFGCGYGASAFICGTGAGAKICL